MTWVPLVEQNQSSPSESVRRRLNGQTEFQNEAIGLLRDILLELKLMNARIETAFETTIQREELDSVDNSRSN